MYLSEHCVSESMQCVPGVTVFGVRQQAKNARYELISNTVSICTISRNYYMVLVKNY